MFSTTPTISVSGLRSGPDPIHKSAPRGLRRARYRFTKASLTMATRCPPALRGTPSRPLQSPPATRHEPGAERGEDPWGDGVQVDVAVGGKSLPALDR